MKKIDLSILILVHNAPKYVEETLTTLNEITDKRDLLSVEIIVVDNASEKETCDLLRTLKEKNYIDKLFFSEENTLFSKGNNIAASLADPESKYFLLLNSDVKIKRRDWLNFLKMAKNSGQCGIASFGFCSYPKRADGYCFLIDRNLYDKYLLDENFQWWWGLTKLQALVLKEGFSILVFDNHDEFIFHYGGKSGKSFTDAKGMNVDVLEVEAWYKNSKGKVIVKSLSKVQGIKKYFIRILKKIYRILLK